jgi:hypothetical protein
MTGSRCRGAIRRKAIGALSITGGLVYCPRSTRCQCGMTIDLRANIHVMAANSFLSILIVLMIVRDLSLFVRERRPFRLAFSVFWILLACAHFTGRSTFYPLIGMSLVVALVMKYRAHSGLSATLQEEKDKKVPLPSAQGLWDREIDGG